MKKQKVSGNSACQEKPSQATNAKDSKTPTSQVAHTWSFRTGYQGTQYCVFRMGTFGVETSVMCSASIDRWKIQLQKYWWQQLLPIRFLHKAA